MADQANKLGMKNIYICDNNEEAIGKIKGIASSEDIVLIKASNGMHFDEFVDAIK